jgi:hypothetical protein
MRKTLLGFVGILSIACCISANAQTCAGQYKNGYTECSAITNENDCKYSVMKHSGNSLSLPYTQCKWTNNGACADSHPCKAGAPWSQQ